VEDETSIAAGATTADGPSFCPIGDDPTCATGRRRRGEELERAILEAALVELAAHGLGHLTMEGVAARAHTGKASVYRRWSSKEDLILDALAHVMPRPDTIETSTGSLRADLLGLLGQTANILSGPKGALVRSLLGEVNPDSSLLAALRVRLIEPRLTHLLMLIRAGIDRGEARPGSATECMAEVGPAVLIHRYLLYGAITPDDVLDVIDNVVLPLLRGGCPAADDGKPDR
jgi:AcrR family transcriptional regulator